MAVVIFMSGLFAMLVRWLVERQQRPGAEEARGRRSRPVTPLLATAGRNPWARLGKCEGEVRLRNRKRPPGHFPLRPPPSAFLTKLAFPADRLPGYNPAE